MTEVTLRNIEPDEDISNLEWFDNTRLEALMGCNFWGMVRYMNHLSFTEPQRNLPLELGTTIHECLAIAMCRRLGKHGLDRARQIINNTDRWNGTGEHDTGDPSLEYMYHNANEADLALSVLYSGDYYDDPDDNRRTLANAEASLLMALRHNNYVPEIINDKVCVELPIKFIVEFDDRKYIYNGRCDLVRKDHNGEYRIVDWKTSSGLSGDWSGQWRTSHQMTGYCAGIALQLGIPINQGNVVGIQIPLPRDAFKGYEAVPFKRYEHQFDSWLQWVVDGIKIYERFKHSPFDATKRTQYCFRYFRMCSFTELCSAHPDDIEDFKNELKTAVWNPEDE